MTGRKHLLSRLRTLYKLLLFNLAKLMGELFLSYQLL